MECCNNGTLSFNYCFFNTWLNSNNLVVSIRTIEEQTLSASFR